MVARAVKRASGSRNDETRVATRRALKAFRRESSELLEVYSRSALVRTVSGAGSLEAVAAAFRAALAPHCVFVLGGPGSGKGTQCARIVAEFGYTHLSAGDLLRAEVTRGSAQGASITACISAGALVPVSVTLALLQQAMRAAPRGARFLIDGFPRALDQAIPFEAAIGAPRFVLSFDCPEPVMRARLLARGATSGRADDNAEVIGKRFRTYVEQSLPVLSHYGVQVGHGCTREGALR